MKIWVVCIGLALASGGNTQPSGEADFAADMLQRMRRSVPGAVLTLKPDEPLVIVRQKSKEEEEAYFNLHRIYNYCGHSSAEDCEASKVEYVAKLTAAPAAITTDRLRLIVRDAGYLEYLRSMPKGDQLGIYEQIGEDLYAMLASDGPHAVAVLGPSSLKELGLSREQAWAVAVKQTRAVLPALPTQAQLVGGAVAFEGHDYGAGLLIDRAAWADLAKQIGPNLFATAVSDHFVFIGVMPDGKDLERFKKTVADDCAGQQRCVSPHLYRFRDGRWVIAR
jgi:hypothetical protein